MRLVKVPASNLRPGMFVAELDRPWLETPFALQGFVIRGPGDVQYLNDYVDHVFVDVDFTGSPRYLPAANEPIAEPHGERLQIRADFQQARTSFETASVALDDVFEKLRGGSPIDFKSVTNAVSPLIEGVYRNQEAVAALLRLKEKGDYRYNHGISMALWGAILGRHLGLHRDELEKLAVGCALCDVGMTELPRDLLHQPHPLSDAQLRIVRAHTSIGVQMVTQSRNADKDVLAIIEHHHERMDGSGYPHGLKGVEIPLLARIAGLVDAYDAMITERPYAQPRTSHEAVQELIDVKGRLFQEALVEQFVQAIGMFPTGTLVELSTGEVAIVVCQNTTRRLKPEVVVVLDADKARKTVLDVVDLAEQNIAGEGERWIARELLPGGYGVNSEEYFI